MYLSHYLCGSHFGQQYLSELWWWLDAVTDQAIKKLERRQLS